MPIYNMMLELKFQIEGIEAAYTGRNQGQNQSSRICYIEHDINFLSYYIQSYASKENI